MRKVHELKTWPNIFKPMWAGVKKFDYRNDDRGFEVGDLLHLREWDPKTEEYTGLELLFTVTYILHGGQFGIPEGYVIMSVNHGTEYVRMWHATDCRAAKG